MFKLSHPLRLVGRVFPIVRWSRSYDLRTGIGDLIAGITIALTLIPQSIAYASLAGFEPQYGLYASFAGGFVYAIMGTCPQINIGPTALLSLLTFTYTSGTNPDFAVLLCFIGGIVTLVAGIAQLGFLVDFVSLPVVSGFTSAAAITIASSQIKGLLGLKFNAESFKATWEGVIHHIGDTRMQDTLLGLACCIVLMGMKAMKDIRLKEPEDDKGRRSAKIIQRALWFVGVSRNAVVVVIASVIAFLVYEDKNFPLMLTGSITPGLPTPQLPPFHSTVGNATASAGEMLAHLGSGLIVVPVVGIISNVAIAKAFSKGKTLDATQEIVTLGVCNIISAFFRSYPVNGSFTRSAVSDASGVRTPAAGFYTGIIVLLTLALLTPYFYFIPRAALSAVIICAVLHMVDIAIIKKLWATSRLDLIPLVGTFICGLALGVEVGLVCGVAVDILLLLYYHSRPPLEVELVDDGTIIPHYAVRPIGGLHFAGAERLRARLVALKYSKSLQPQTIDTIHVTSDGDEMRITVPNGISGTIVKPLKVLVIHCDALSRMDYTFLESMKMLVSDWSREGCVIWCDAKPAVQEQLNTVLQQPIFCSLDQLSTILTRNFAIDTQVNNICSDTPL
ncbi:PREDICTED: sodium-independent sulfate anion transporter-like [Papilio polytes]|uniref:sodium-independent sulfate anion transporter-like n=1 Tax=Papilio polytes TaxID=76194 RepID=UPI000676A79C|nr:PREDICTED: sodium-independent sulfate anion transporter-like [Papilio polytes]